MKADGGRLRTTLALTALVLAAALLAPSVAGASLDGGKQRHRGRTPVVVFPAYHFTKLQVRSRTRPSRRDARAQAPSRTGS